MFLKKTAHQGLTNCGQVTHICVSKLFIIGSDNCLLPSRRQAIIWTNIGMLLIWPLGTYFSEKLIKTRRSSFKEMHFKTSSVKCQPFCDQPQGLRKPSEAWDIACYVITLLCSVHAMHSVRKSYMPNAYRKSSSILHVVHSYMSHCGLCVMF